MAFGAGSAWGGYTAAGTVAADVAPPQITALSPPAGTPITSAQVISFNITDNISLAAVVLIASYPDGTNEVIFDSSGFRGSFVGGSNSRTPIASGHAYTVLRNGGWTKAPTIEFLPIDTAGNLGAIS